MTREPLGFTRGRPKRLFVKHIVRKIFLEDWALKLIALVISFALWLGVAGLSTPTTKRFTVPLNFNVSNNAEITNTPIQEVDIVLSGDKRKIDQINRAELSASIDLTDVPPGDRVLQLTPDTVYVPLPTGVKLDEVQPGRIAVRLEAVEEKDIAVNAEIEGEPADGFEIYSETVTPQKVRVRGPASYIKTLDFVLTDKIDVAGKREDFTVRQVPVSVSNPKAAVFNTVVDVSFRIGEKRVERTFSIPAGGKHITAVLYGPKTMLSKVKLDDLKAEIVKTDSGSDSPQLTLPESLQGNVQIRTLKITP